MAFPLNLHSSAYAAPSQEAGAPLIDFLFLIFVAGEKNCVMATAAANGDFERGQVRTPNSCSDCTYGIVQLATFPLPPAIKTFKFLSLASRSQAFVTRPVDRQLWRSALFPETARPWMSGGRGVYSRQTRPLPDGFHSLSPSRMILNTGGMVAAVRKGAGLDIDVILEIHRKLTPMTATALAKALDTPFFANVNHSSEA